MAPSRDEVSVSLRFSFRLSFMFSSRAFRSDKYVTRAEYDQLRSRVKDLESIIARIATAGTVHMQPTMISAPTMPPGAGPSNPPYVHHGRSTSGSYGLGPEYGSDPYSVNTRPPVTALPSSSRTTLSGEINPPSTEREISSSRQYQAPHRPASRQFRHTLGPVTAAPSYRGTEGTEERPKKRSAWTQQGVRPRQSCRAVDLVLQSRLYSILLPSLFLLVCLPHLLILQQILLRLFPWKSLQKVRPTIGPIHQEGYGIVGRIATQSPRWLSPPTGVPEIAGSSRNRQLWSVTNDRCQTHEIEPTFPGLGRVVHLSVLA
jgi:hypothetical protein